MYKLSLLVLILASSFSSQAKSKFCSEIFFDEQFIFNDPRIKLYEKKERGVENDNNNIFLGEGASAQVWLTFSSENLPIVKKIYRGTIADHAKADSASLFTLLKLKEQGYQIPFRLLENKIYLTTEYTVYNTYVMILPYTKGRTVHDLLIAPEIPIHFKNIIRSKFNQNVNSFARGISSIALLPKLFLSSTNEAYKTYFRDRQDDQTNIYKVNIGDKEYIIKSDNVIVDPYTLEMTLIDPI